MIIGCNADEVLMVCFDHVMVCFCSSSPSLKLLVFGFTCGS